MENKKANKTSVAVGAAHEQHPEQGNGDRKP